jgi:hypothetical protein
MSIVVRYNPPSLTAEQYEEGDRLLREAGVEPLPDGLDYHVCLAADGHLRVTKSGTLDPSRAVDAALHGTRVEEACTPRATGTRGFDQNDLDHVNSSTSMTLRQRQNDSSIPDASLATSTSAGVLSPDARYAAIRSDADREPR